MTRNHIITHPDCGAHSPAKPWHCHPQGHTHTNSWLHSEATSVPCETFICCRNGDTDPEKTEAPELSLGSRATHRPLGPGHCCQLPCHPLPQGYPLCQESCTKSVVLRFPPGALDCPELSPPIYPCRLHLLLRNSWPGQPAFCPQTGNGQATVSGNRDLLQSLEPPNDGNTLPAQQQNQFVSLAYFPCMSRPLT